MTTSHRFREEFQNYQIYGITLRSEIPLPYPIATYKRAADVRLAIAPPGLLETVRQGLPLPSSSEDWYDRVQLPDGSEFLRWPELFEFLVSPDGRSIVCRDLEQATLESLQTYLLGHVLSYALVKQHHEPLHATAVIVDGAAIALLGQSGQGKSTLAAAFLRAGHTLLTDDLLVMRRVDDLIYGFPGPPRLKLFPDALERFLPELAASGLMNPLTEKLIVPIPSRQSHSGAAAIGAFVVLDGGESAAQSVARITGTSAWTELLGATFNKKLVDRPRLRRQFQATREWTARVPVMRATYNWALEEAEHVRDAIIAGVFEEREVRSA